MPYVTWGCGFVDFDNDGHRDLFIVCGHIHDNVEHHDDTTSYRCHNIVLRNLGNGKFVNVTDQSGDVAKLKMSGRGVAFDDLDNDGRIDVVILNSNDRPTILRNETVNDNHWIQIRLQGVKTNRDGVGARVYVVAGDLTADGRGTQRPRIPEPLGDATAFRPGQKQAGPTHRGPLAPQRPGRYPRRRSRGPDVDDRRR